MLISILVIGLYGYFYSNGGSNQNARLDSIYAFVEPGYKESYTSHKQVPTDAIRRNKHT